MRDNVAPKGMTPCNRIPRESQATPNPSATIPYNAAAITHYAHIRIGLDRVSQIANRANIPHNYSAGIYDGVSDDSQLATHSADRGASCHAHSERSRSLPIQTHYSAERNRGRKFPDFAKDSQSNVPHTYPVNTAPVFYDELHVRPYRPMADEALHD